MAQMIADGEKSVEEVGVALIGSGTCCNLRPNNLGVRAEGLYIRHERRADMLTGKKCRNFAKGVLDWIGLLSCENNLPIVQRSDRHQRLNRHAIFFQRCPSALEQFFDQRGYASQFALGAADNAHKAFDRATRS